MTDRFSLEREPSANRFLQSHCKQEHLLPTRDQLRRAQEIVDRERSRLDGQLQLVYVPCDYYERRPKACLHGWGSRSLTVNPRGDVLPCQAASEIPGLTFDNVTKRSLSWI